MAKRRDSARRSSSILSSGVSGFSSPPSGPSAAPIAGADSPKAKSAIAIHQQRVANEARRRAGLVGEDCIGTAQYYTSASCKHVPTPIGSARLPEIKKK